MYLHETSFKKLLYNITILQDGMGTDDIDCWSLKLVNDLKSKHDVYSVDLLLWIMNIAITAALSYLYYCVFHFLKNTTWKHKLEDLFVFVDHQNGMGLWKIAS